MYFVMLRHQNGNPIPLIDLNNGYDELPVLFETEEEAIEAGKNNIFGEHFGFEVYEWD